MNDHRPYHPDWHSGRTLKPMPRAIPMRWPVWSFANPHQPVVAWFFDYDAAVDFVNASERNLYIGEPRYDRRKAVWARHEQLVDVEQLETRQGRARVAL